MGKISDYFYIKVSDDKMVAELYCKEQYPSMDMKLDMQMLIEYLKENQVIYGIKKSGIELVLNKAPAKRFPIVIANGKHSENGIDGEITFHKKTHSEIKREAGWNFRDVMKIPTVNKGEKLATISLPTRGIDGKNVHGTVLRARPGKPVLIKAGKDVAYHSQDQTFYAESEGQLNVTSRFIQIEDVYTVDETLSMKTGNLDFVGSIVIRGDVPTGYSVKAAGDIKIYGIVEAATIISGGSIYISEGLSGLQKGAIEADKDVHIGYINQGKVVAGQSIYVENSIIHSESTARDHILCHHGNIIGGSLSAGKSIEASDIGNRLSTETAINLGLNKAVNDERIKLENKKKELTKTLIQLETIGEKLKDSKMELDAKMRITMLRQRRSHEQITGKIDLINKELEELDAHLGSEEEAHLTVKNHLHSNVIISFGKYKRKINQPRRRVQLRLNNNDIVIHALKN